MGRENESSIAYSLKPVRTSETIIVKQHSRLEKCGYTTPTQRELYKKVEYIRKEDPKKMMQHAVDLYGERIISSIVAEGDPRNLKTWLDNPDSYTLNGNTDRSLTKIAVSLDFADQMEQNGAEKDVIRNTFIERQSKLGDLSVNTALARIGPEDIGIVHEISQSIAKGVTQILTEADKTHAERFAENYTLPETSRGH